MDIRLLILFWVAKSVGLSVANEDFLREVQENFEIGRKAAGWDSRASWIRQIKGAKGSPSLKDLEKWWRSPSNNPSYGHKSKIPTEFWLSSPQAETTANGFVPIGWRSPTKGHKLPPKFFSPHPRPFKGWKHQRTVKGWKPPPPVKGWKPPPPVKGWKPPPPVKGWKKLHPVRKGRLPRIKPWGRLRHPKRWTPRKIKDYAPLIKHPKVLASPKIPGWRLRAHGHKKDYVPLMKNLIPKTVEHWPPADTEESKCWPPNSENCDSPYNDEEDISSGPTGEGSVDDELDKSMPNFFTTFNAGNSEPIVNPEETENEEWDNSGPPLGEGWNSDSNEESPPIHNDEENNSEHQEWPASHNSWPPTPAVSQWNFNSHNEEVSPFDKPWAPPTELPPAIDEEAEDAEVPKPGVGANSFAGWKLTKQGWMPPYDSWTPVTSEWTPVPEWSPPKNVWSAPAQTWFPPKNDWSPMTSKWPESEPESEWTPTEPHSKWPQLESKPSWTPPHKSKWPQSESKPNWTPPHKSKWPKQNHRPKWTTSDPKSKWRQSNPSGRQLHHQDHVTFVNKPRTPKKLPAPVAEQNKNLGQSRPPIYWDAPSPQAWTQMTTNWANEIKGLINQVTHRIF